MLSFFTLIALTAYTKPFYIGFRIGFNAEWQIVIGDCQDGNGACLSVGKIGDLDNAELGFDENRKNVFFIRVNKENETAKHFSGSNFELLADSPVDPKLIEKIKTFKNPYNKIVILKKGKYPIIKEKDFFVVAVEFYEK